MRSLISFIPLALGISVCHAEADIPLSNTQIQSLGITTVQLTPAKQGSLSGLPAQVVVPGNQMRIISTPAPALIEQILVGVGDNVHKGQALAKLQSPALIEAQRGLLQASVQAKLSQENLVRDEQLWKDGIISESRYRTTRGMQMETAAALSERQQLLRLSGMSDAAIRQLQSGQSISSLLTLTAPMDGTILEKSANVGQRLDAATPIFKLAQLNPLALEIQAPLSAASIIKSGAKVWLPKPNARGKIIAVGRSLSGTNQTILLRAEITQGTDLLRPGQFVEASVATSESTTDSHLWIVPSSAISRVNGKSIIFLASKIGFRPTEVQILSESEKSAFISADLKGNEKIAVHGVSALKAQMMGIGGGE